MQSKGQEFRSGYVAIIGRPNVGKSTLLNHILGQKISITARKSQTTRYRIQGVKTTETYQAVFVDTPGIDFSRKRAINRYMTRAAMGALLGVDLIVFVVEALRWTPDDARISTELGDLDTPVVLAVNKVDRVREKARLLPFLEATSRELNFVEIVPLTARRRQDTDRFAEIVAGHLPHRQATFPGDQITDRSERFLAAELVREKLTRRLGQELPYRVTVEIDRFSEEEDLVSIAAIIWVERAGQKAIIVGEDGRALKAVGTESRRELERMLDKRVFLDLWVKVKAGWSDDEQFLRSMGYDDY